MHEANPFSRDETLKIVETRPQETVNGASFKAIRIVRALDKPSAKPLYEDIDRLLRSVPNPEEIRLIDIDYESNLTRMPDVSRFENIQYAHVAGRKITDYDFLHSLTSLESLFLVNYKYPDLGLFDHLDLSSFRAIRGKIERLHIKSDSALIQGCAKLISMESSSIRVLTLETCNNIDLYSLGRTSELEDLNLLGCKSVTSLDFVRDCKTLKSLTITATPTSKLDFSVLKGAESLQRVFVGAGNATIEKIAVDNPQLTVTNNDVTFIGGTMQ